MNNFTKEYMKIMGYFNTKEYIAECDCEAIQGIRPKIKIGDWYAFADTLRIYNTSIADRNINRFGESQIWLPTGDQLDEEIIKLCKKTKLVYKVIHYSNDITKAFIYNSDSESGEPIYAKRVEFQVSDVCLIAKIRLLKELIKESEG